MTTPSEEGSAALKSGAHIPALDGIRGLAILVVLLHHSNRITEPAGYPLKLAHKLMEAGWVGVDLFFVLSGFLITGILAGAKGKSGYFRSFYMRRVLRIFPLYYLAIFLMLFVFPFLFHNPAWKQSLEQSQVWFWTYLLNYAIVLVTEAWPPYASGHIWSLCVEEQFYIIWPFLIYALNRKRAIALCMAVIALGPVFRGVLLLLHHTDPLPFDGRDVGYIVANYMFLPGRMDALAIGSVIALVARGPDGLHRLIAPARWVLIVGGAILLALAIQNAGVLSWYNVPTQLLGYSALGLAFGASMVIVLTNSGGPMLQRVLTSAPLRFLGKYSYSIYVFHVAMYLLVHKYLFGDAARVELAGSQAVGQLTMTVVGGAGSIAFAFLTWHLFEKHFLKLKRWFPR